MRMFWSMRLTRTRHSMKPHALCSKPAEARPRQTLYVTPQILCEFYAIVTNARRVKEPRTSADGLAALSGMLGFLRVLPVPGGVIDEVMALLRRRPVTGGEVFDLRIIATMKLNGIDRIYTFNTDDFKPFAEIEALAP